jgi:SAM-dependent methyltransferase
MYQKEEIQCILCQSGETEVFNESATESVHNRNVICKRCGLIFISPRLREEDYLRYYEHGDYVKDHYGLASEKDVDEIIRWRGRRANEKIACFSDLFSSGKDVLEIGAGTGVFLNELTKRFGSRVFGIEPSRQFADIARKRFGIEVYEGTLRGYCEEQGTRRLYDLIVMDQVLEHLYDPIDALTRIRSLLQKDGMVYIGVPNIANPKHPREEFFIGPHIYTFNPWTIMLLLWRVGLKIVQLQAPAASPMYLMATPLENPVPMFPLKDIPGPFSAAELARRIDDFGK